MTYGLTHHSKRNKKMSKQESKLYKQGVADFEARKYPQKHHWQYKAGYYNAKCDAEPELQQAKKYAKVIIYLAIPFIFAATFSLTSLVLGK